MLLNLFDEHEDCCVYPTDISVLYGYFPVYCRDGYSIDERLIRLDIVVFGTLSRLREKHDLGDRLPVEDMREHFFEMLDRTRLDRIDVVIRQLVDSFRSAVGLRIGDRPVVVLKETSLEIYAQELMDWFPGSRFVQLLRDPRDNYAALRAGVGKHYSLFGEGDRHILASLLHRVGIGMGLIEPNRTSLGEDKLLTVRFEELTADPESLFREIGRFGGLQMDGIALQPTVLGRPTAGNNYDGEKFLQVSQRNVGRWRERISDFEAQVIEFHLGSLMQQQGYELAYSEEERARAAADFYKWTNYQYFFKDSFAVMRGVVDANGSDT
jgi:hypothetical protein